MAGNATVALYSPKSNSTIVYDVWIASISTATNNQYAQQQLRDHMSFQPIRRSEMYVQFTIAWPLQTANVPLTVPAGFEGIDYRDGFTRMNTFQSAIRDHQQAAVSSLAALPMVLNYNPSMVHGKVDKLTSLSWTGNTAPTPSTLVYSGWVQQSEQEYTRYKNLFLRNYTMNILNPNISSTPLTSMVVNSQFAPSSSTQNNYGSDWPNIAILATQTAAAINGIKQQ